MKRVEKIEIVKGKKGDLIGVPFCLIDKKYQQMLREGEEWMVETVRTIKDRRGREIKVVRPIQRAVLWERELEEIRIYESGGEELFRLRKGNLYVREGFEWKIEVKKAERVGKDEVSLEYDLEWRYRKLDGKIEGYIYLDLETAKKVGAGAGRISESWTYRLSEAKRKLEKLLEGGSENLPGLVCYSLQSHEEWKAKREKLLEIAKLLRETSSIRAKLEKTPSVLAVIFWDDIESVLLAVGSDIALTYHLYGEETAGKVSAGGPYPHFAETVILTSQIEGLRKEKNWIEGSDEGDEEEERRKGERLRELKKKIEELERKRWWEGAVEEIKRVALPKGPLWSIDD